MLFFDMRVKPAGRVSNKRPETDVKVVVKADVKTDARTEKK